MVDHPSWCAVAETGKKVLFPSDTSTIPWRIQSSSVEEEGRGVEKFVSWKMKLDQFEDQPRLARKYI